MQVRRKIINQCKGTPRLQKALAMALYLKWHLGRSSCLQNYTINKLRTITGVSATTLKKYIRILKQLGWVRFDGKDEQHIVIGKLSSHNEKRNIKVDKFCHKTFRDTYYSLRAFIALTIQAKKDFIKRTLQSVREPKGGKEFRSTLKLVKRLVKQGVLNSRYDEFKDFGISLKRIAKETGNCVRTAFNTMKYAIENGWATKQRNYEQFYAPRISKEDMVGFHFSTNNNLYIIHANKYNIKASVLNDIGMVSFLDGKK